MTDRLPGFDTLAIHAGAAPDAATGARATPIYQTTSFVFDDVDHAASLFGLQAFGNIYSRIGNPTCAVLEERVAALEGGTAALAVASGHAAQVLVFHALMQPGDEFVVGNTMASPYLIRPFEHGADIIVHSATKFLGGHGNSIGGVIVDGGTFNFAGDDRYPMLSKPRPEYGGMVLGETFGNFGFAIACRVLGLRDLGPALSPFNAFLILNGIETLPLRMQRHSDNALAVAEHLASHDKVSSVNYAGLSSDKYNNLARKYAPKGAGAVFTFSLKGGYEAGVNLVSNLKLFSHLANVGDTRSLVIHPASTTHSQLDDAAKIKSGAAPHVVRLSIGIEDKEDLIADLEQALTV